MSKPHHKPRNVTLTKITRLRKAWSIHFHPTFVPDTAADKAIAGQHLGFDVSVRALQAIRGY